MANGQRIRMLSGVASFLMVLVWSVIAVAAAAQVASPEPPSWFEHVDLMQVVIAGLFVMVLWFLTRTLGKIDSNQSRLFQKLDEVCKQVDTLQGEHNAIKARCERGRE